MALYTVPQILPSFPGVYKGTRVTLARHNQTVGKLSVCQVRLLTWLEILAVPLLYCFACMCLSKAPFHQTSTGNCEATVLSIECHTKAGVRRIKVPRTEARLLLIILSPQYF